MMEYALYTHSLRITPKSEFKTITYFIFVIIFAAATTSLFAQNSKFTKTGLASDVRLNEILASNHTILQDEDGEYSDWIEIYNSGSHTIDLTGWYLSDDSTNLKKWQFPAVSLPAGEFLIVFASDKNRTSPQLHTNFKLTTDGEFLALTQPDTTIIASEYRPGFPPQASDYSFGALGGSAAYFSTPTPGAANSSGTVDLALSGNHISEHSPNDTYIGTFITTDIDTSTATSYSLSDDAGGRFKIAGNELQVANSVLLDFDTDTSHQITARTTYNDGTTLDRAFTIYLIKVYSTDLQISEFMASNQSTLQDEDGDYSDWIEIHNTGITDVNLENWYITDGDGDLTQWQFPARNLTAGGYLVIFASSKDRLGAELHTNFKLGASGEYLGLVQPNGDIIVSEYAPQFPPQSADWSYGLYNGIEQFFDVPTPGSANTDGTLPVDPLTITPERGFHNFALDVTISTTTPAAEIRYTLDGSKPTPSHGSTYSGPISVTTTSILRAAAFKTGYRSTRVETHTYLFLDDVIHQPYDIPGYPVKYYSVNGDEVLHDYEMDPVIVDDPAYSGTIIKGLTDIPTMVIVVDPDSLFGANFFYDGDAIEQKVSMEYLDFQNPNKNDQIDCGIEGHSHLRLKRSLRLSFRSEYGSSSWSTPLFENAPLNGDGAKEDQKRIVLRGGNNRSWARTSNPDRTTYTEDQWFRDSQIAMSGYGPHGNFVHLYINGIYWGLYNPVERPDNFFSSAYFGGADEDWFAINHDGIISGNDTRYEHLTKDLVNNDMTNPSNYSEIQEYLDLDNFIDDLILHWYGSVTDWPDNNWWAGNQNIPADSYRYYFWDGEWCWDVARSYDSPNGAWVHPDQRAGVSANDEHSEIWTALRENDDFMIRFADRVYLHCFNGGALTDSSSMARWNTLNQYVRDAIIAESAKWGDCQMSLGDPRRTRDEDWQDEVDAIADIMDGNVAQFLVALRNEGYYPDNDPPLFSQSGAMAPNSFSVTLSNPNSTGTIYFTTDASDPRLSGGGISGSAQEYNSAIILNDTATIKTRVLDENEWSSLNLKFFQVTQDPSPSLNVKVFLEGPYVTGGTLTNWLMGFGYVPLSHPYGGAPWYHSGTESVTSMPSTITDWIFLELRGDIGADTRVSGRAAFLKNDGTIVDLDGVSPVQIDVAPRGDYYLVVHHRNHLPIMSANKISINPGSTVNYDFTTGIDKYYGADYGAIELEPGVWGMIAGDGNNDGGIYGEDYTLYKLNQGEESYHPADFNMDGGCYGEDYTIYKINQGRESLVFLPNSLVSKVPLKLSKQMVKDAIPPKINDWNYDSRNGHKR